MIKEVAKNNYYSMSVDTAKNRYYLKFVGTWVKASNVPKFLDDVEESLKLVSKGFTILNDLSEMKLQSQEINEMFGEAQKQMIAAGVSKATEVAPKDTIVRMQLDKIAKESGIQKKMHDTRDEAENFLDE